MTTIKSNHHFPRDIEAKTEKKLGQGGASDTSSDPRLGVDTEAGNREACRTIGSTFARQSLCAKFADSGLCQQRFLNSPTGLLLNQHLCQVSMCVVLMLHQLVSCLWVQADECPGGLPQRQLNGIDGKGLSGLHHHNNLAKPNLPSHRTWPLQGWQCRLPRLSSPLSRPPAST
ncbi:hypothetical protein BD779DRAFT_1101654 [Infundibulicybe gibba]|nr:hypothetical protein BD779DRAFT_1101654 [Infundibulicybe gibba]